MADRCAPQGLAERGSRNQARPASVLVAVSVSSDGACAKSARYAGEHGNDKANRDKVLHELNGVEERAARFRTVICFHDGVRTLFAEGVCHGQILQQEKGDHGFGYDSIFLPDGASESFAEMPHDQKNSMSHRKKALDALRQIFERYLE